MKVKPLLGLLCHQESGRCYHFSESLYVCARCMGIYLGFLCSLPILFALYGFFHGAVYFFATLFFFIPMALDGGTQLFGWRESNNTLRLVSGYLSGMAVAYLVYALVTQFLAREILVLLPTNGSFILLLIPLALTWFVFKKYQNKPNPFLSKFFNAVITFSTVLLIVTIVALWIGLAYVSLIS